MDSRQRDIGLILLGAALTTDRPRVLAEVKPGSLPYEIDGLLNALRKDKTSVVAEWLSKRGVKVDGKGFLSSLCEAANEWKHREKARKLAAELDIASHTEGRSEFHERLLKYAKEFEPKAP